MRDPQPGGALLIAELLALLALTGWWCGLTPAERGLHLHRVYVAEQAATVPPEGMLTQAAWLTTHRFARLQGLQALGGIALLIGAGEGWARRRQDVLGGFLLRWWTTGVVGLALLPGAVAGFLLAPWPLSTLGSASTGAALVGLTMYGLTAGRPYVP
jgi:hypothetical protein